MVIIFVFGFSFVSTKILPDDPSAYIAIAKSFQLALAMVILITIIYFLIILFIYTYFKYGIVDMINSMKNNHHHNSLSKFYKLNLAVYGLPVIVFVTFYFLSVFAFRIFEVNG